jgi:predicted TIM-barrel fold metal-dependent hydrolase
VAIEKSIRIVNGRSMELPNIISVDDHVMEPPTLWTSRLPKKYVDKGPHVVREKGKRVGKNFWKPDDDGQWGDVWHYEDNVASVITMELANAGFGQSEMSHRPMTYDGMRPGCWQQPERLKDMTLDHVDVSVCFPNVLPRFCGQTFSEGSDKQLGLLSVQAYNDWMIDEWCAGEGYGRLIPLTLIPLWDTKLAADEVYRCAAKGSHAVAFSESTFTLGFTSIYTGAWNPFFEACNETDTVICIHIGSSSRMAETNPQAAQAFGAVSPLSFQYGMHSLVDIVLSGTMERYPNIKVAYSECNVGWMPYILERMDILWERALGTQDQINLKERPSSYVKGRVFGCVVDDAVGIATRDFSVGMDQLTFESDYPHGNSSFPHTLDLAAELIEATGLNDDEIYKFLRGNAIDAFGLSRYGITA